MLNEDLSYKFEVIYKMNFNRIKAVVLELM